jgi:predicted peptidase
MKGIITLICGCLLVTSTGCSYHKAVKAPDGSQVATTMKKTVKKTYELDYLLYLPDNYSESSEPFPLMLLLHGSNQRGDDINLVKKAGPPKLVEQGQDFPFIIVSPQCPEGKGWATPYMLDELNCLLDDIIEHYSVDTSRIYLTGFSMGGFGTFGYALFYPERFAAIAPICGGGLTELALYIKDIPTWVFHGEKDEVVPITMSRNMVEALKKVDGNVKFTVYPDAGHDSWTETYNNPELYEWFLKQRRKF